MERKGEEERGLEREGDEGKNQPPIYKYSFAVAKRPRDVVSVSS